MSKRKGLDSLYLSQPIHLIVAAKEGSKGISGILGDFKRPPPNKSSKPLKHSGKAAWNGSIDMGITDFYIFSRGEND